MCRKNPGCGDARFKTNTKLYMVAVRQFATDQEPRIKDGIIVGILTFGVYASSINRETLTTPTYQDRIEQ